MNQIEETTLNVTEFQLVEFQKLIARLFQCCQDRMQYQSDRFKLPDAELRCILSFEDERYLTPKNIASRMNVGKSRVTKIISGLEEKKLIQRIKDPEDSRIYLISLTNAGKKKVLKIKQFHDDIHEKILLQVNQEQRKNMLANLDLLKACMEAGKEMMK
ncbi:MAG: winged helix-turn-helix transcriptional regulator [Deltaproteobacteria bacterium]|uniref:MarR family winged helix-turn-helix transcriptional regulator n=1 Tax=Desulfobacula sp. TaxID=2593537 RepID=UPI00198E18AF|nr:winged helix-turn-helix transcriptional regulator [Candidatus Desulfobacula maris]MBL6994389.1 winged helix-turn-helix transcriptional regulator [Desulfobacula sp.]